MASTNKKFHSDVQIKSDIIIDGSTVNTVPVFDANKKIKSSIVTTTELERLSGVTSNVQTQIDSAQTDATQALADAAAAQADATQALADAAAAQAAADAAQADIDQEILDRAADVDAEETRALAAEAALQAEIDAVEATVAALPDPIYYAGTWNATTNTPALANADVGAQGKLYRVTVAGTQDLGAGNITFVVGDKIVNNGTFWEKWDVSDEVTSVNGQAGVVVLQADDINRADDSETIEASLDSLETDVAAAQADATQALADAAAAQADIDAHIAQAVGAHAATAISYDDTITGYGLFTVQEVVDQLFQDEASTNSALSAHISAASDAHAASAISVSPSSGIAATDAQAALEEISLEVADAQADATQALADAATAQAAADAAQADIDAHIAAASDAHDASAISFDNVASGLTATDVQAALDEIVSSIGGIGSPGDIDETSFSLANNQTSDANVTGFAFSNAVVRSFEALVIVEIDATADLYEQFHLNGIQRGADWAMSVESEGDDSGIIFSITNAGQVQYQSANVAGFATGVIKFRAITTSV